MKIKLENWKLIGSWPFTVMLGDSVETGVKLKGVTPEIDAKVPGSVYDDLLRAGIIEAPYYERNSLLCEWVANRFWSYTTSFTADPKNKKIRIVFKGIDYHAHIYLNNEKIGEHVGMYTKCVIDITDKLKADNNNLTVVLENAPDEMGQIGYTSRTFTQKARFGYKWDFGTRLVNLGLYDEVYLDICDDPIKNTNIKYEENGTLTVTAENTALSGTLKFGDKVIGEVNSHKTEYGCKLVFNIPEPELWYPNGTVKGRKTQPLYDLILRSVDDEKIMRVGLRTLNYERCRGADESVFPYIPVINGKQIYIKGVNMTPIDHMYGCVDRERYRKTLETARDANVNLIRVWGGGIIEKEDFYDLCDEYGIMVWQEFIQSSSGIDNIPSKRPEFLELCRKTVEDAVPEKRNHVSLTFWSGGNELMDANSIPSTLEDENIALIKEITDRLDPDHLLLPTSASGPTEWFDPAHPERNQDIHGPWKYEGVEGQYSLYNSSTIQLHSEFGVDGMSNMSAIEKVLAPENRKVTTMGENLSWRHHGEWWDTYGYRERPIFGELTELSDLVILSQYMQAEGIRYALEAHRRRSDSTEFAHTNYSNDKLVSEHQNCGAIVWQFNEPWPNVSCTCMLDYYCNPKLAYYFYRDAEKPLHISMKYDKFLWNKGETFRGKIFVNDDIGEGYDLISVKVYGANYSFSGNRAEVKTEAVDNGSGLEVEYVIDENKVFYVECELKNGDYTDKNVYMFLIRGENGFADKEPVIKYFNEYKR